MIESTLFVITYSHHKLGDCYAIECGRRHSHPLELSFVVRLTVVQKD
jgi:hypothetical protein